MKKIIQLNESEYNNLVKSASLSKSEIKQLAEDMYKERGTFEIKLELDCRQDYNEKIAFRAYSYVKDWDNRFPLSEEDKRKIVKFVNYRALRMMEQKFGSQITNINLWNRRFELLRAWKIKFIGITIFGWLAAATLLVLFLTNK